MKNTPDNKQLRAIGHNLRPVVTVAGKGLSDTVLAELERALNDHELIKVKLAVGGRETRTAVAEELCERTRRREQASARAHERDGRRATDGGRQQQRR